MKKLLTIIFSLLLTLTLISVSVINNEVKADESNTDNYLTFTANTNNSSVTFNNFNATNIKYSTDNGSTWTDCSSKGCTIRLNKKGDSVKFKGDNVSYGCRFKMTGSISASGDVTSLTNGVGGDADLTNDCYFNLFQDCTSLTTAPNLPSTTLSDSCYMQMFAGCTSLTVAPALPATTLTTRCYDFMFSRCSNLTSAPALPATTLAKHCYRHMFSRCSKLAIAPALPATSLATGCYEGMFEDCTSLITTPILPAKVLYPDCYFGMFAGCTKLEVPADMSHVIKLASYCCDAMYARCSSLKVYTSSTTNYEKQWMMDRCAAAESWNSKMFFNTGGPFQDDPSLDRQYEMTNVTSSIVSYVT